MYKLVQHLRDYVNFKDKKSPVEIKSRMAQNWLHRLDFEYKDIKKHVFINRHKQPDVVKDCKRFLKTMEELQLYMVEFNEDGTMKNKEYLLNCIVGRGIWRLIIVITHDKCMFSANDGICKA